MSEQELRIRELEQVVDRLSSPVTDQEWNDEMLKALRRLDELI